VKYAAIADWAADTQYPVTFMCAQLEVSRSGYYRWLAQGPCQRERTDAELTEQIRQIHTELHGNPGCGGSGPNWSCAATGWPASGSGG
jgi:putative transposase